MAELRSGWAKENLTLLSSRNKHEGKKMIHGHYILLLGRHEMYYVISD